MVRVGEGFIDYFPSIHVIQHFLVDEDSQQLDDCDRGVSVIQLDRLLLLELVPRLPCVLELVDQVPDRSTHEEVLLLESELLPSWRRVVRIQH